MLKDPSAAFSAASLARRDSLVSHIFNGLRRSEMAAHPCTASRVPKNLFQLAVVVGLPLAGALTAAGILAGAPAAARNSLPLLTSASMRVSPQGTPAFIGSERCRICHQDIGAAFRSNPHFNASIEVDGSPRQGCETCHGGGGDHARSMNPDLIRRFNRGTPVQESAVCLDCHAAEATHPDRFFDAHQSDAVGCSNCHSIHAPEAASPLLRSTPNELCADCHPGEAARFIQPFSHRVDSGAVACIDCHRPHGSPSGFQLAAVNANEAACLDCHGDKRGPFAFEHMPAAVGGCVTCHEPHGSPNPRMLIRHEVRLVCLECHTSSTAAFGATPPSFHDLRSPRFENCTLCHTRIHGSHLSSALLR